MAGIKPYILDALPGTYEASAMYMIKDASRINYFSIYLANNTGTAVRRLPSIQDVTDEIASAVSGASSILFAADITDRDALALDTNALVYVQDAAADPNVTAGAALYFYQFSTTTFHRAAEMESMDLQLNWANLQNKPSSAVADIDDAVSKRHPHTNMTTLNALSLDGNGNLVVNGIAFDGTIQLGAAPTW